jgi:hypothetical protein
LSETKEELFSKFREARSSIHEGAISALPDKKVLQGLFKDPKDLKEAEIIY